MAEAFRQKETDEWRSNAPKAAQPRKKDMERAVREGDEAVAAVMADLAFNHGLWYGILSSVIAILAGLGIGLVFQSKGAH